MGVPQSLIDLVDDGILDRVVRPLMSGKEAQVFLVEAGGEHRVAKIYKEANNRSFHQRAIYAEGRRVRNSRRQRAIDKRTSYGKREEELAWKSAEVDAIYKLSAAGVRVPRPYDFVDGVLIMELIADATGEPAPRMVDHEFSPAEARDLLGHLVREVCKMLCAGLVHGDLSDFNILMSPTGPVIIDFPQAVDAAANNNARRLLIRDLDNLQRFLGRWAPSLKKLRYGAEMWDLYEKGVLTPDSPLTGRFQRRGRKADTDAVLREIAAAEKEERARRERLGLAPVPGKSRYAEKKRKAREEAAKAADRPKPQRAAKQAPRPRSESAPEQPAKKRRRRRSRGKKPRETTATANRAPSEQPDLPPDLDAFLLIGD